MRKILKDKISSVAMVGAAVAILVTLMVSILIVFNIAASVDTTAIDAQIGPAGRTPAANATQNAVEQSETFYTIAPIIVIVLAAVVILSYITRLGR